MSSHRHKLTPVPGRGPCVLCGTLAEPTKEHILPQTLWKRFGIDPDREDLVHFWTTLCNQHNAATSLLHQREEMMQLLTTGEPVTRKTLEHLGDWIMWVSLLYGLERGSAPLGREATRQLLLDRFGPEGGRAPKKIRVYAARVDEYVEPAALTITPYALALHGDRRLSYGPNGELRGLSVTAGSVSAAESIGIGKLVLLVVGRSLPSGPDHDARLDQAAASVGLERIRPLPDPLPALRPTAINMTNVIRLFTPVPFSARPFGVDASLLPEELQLLLQTLHGKVADEDLAAT